MPALRAHAPRANGTADLLPPGAATRVRGQEPDSPRRGVPVASRRTAPASHTMLGQQERGIPQISADARGSRRWGGPGARAVCGSLESRVQAVRGKSRSPGIGDHSPTTNASPALPIDPTNHPKKRSGPICPGAEPPNEFREATNAAGGGMESGRGSDCWLTWLREMVVFGHGQTSADRVRRWDLPRQHPHPRERAIGGCAPISRDTGDGTNAVAKPTGDASPPSL